MTSVDFVVVANIIRDDLSLPDGTEQPGILGGAGTYAAAGMRIWSEHVGIVSGVGEDFEELYGYWFDQNQIDKSGLLSRAANTPRSWINYRTPDDRIETPRYGPQHFKLMEPTAEDLPISYLGARGLYLFRDADTEYWDKVFKVREKHHPTVIWEIHAGAANPHSWNSVSAILARIDLFSINHGEASQLCSVTDPIGILDRLLATGVHGVALRAGSTGTIVADQTGAWRIPPYPVEVTDVTGAGNAFTGGFLVGYCESASDISVAGQYGAVSASLMLEQFGPPARLNAETQQLAQTRRESLAPIRIA